MTGYLPLMMCYSDERIDERVDIMKKAGIWQCIDFRFPEGLMQDEKSYLTQAWETMSEEDIKKLARLHNISYVIREKSLPLELQKVQKKIDPKFVIYDLSKTVIRDDGSMEM